MTQGPEQLDSVELEYGKGKLKAPGKRMAEIVATLLSIAFVLNAYILHVHAGKDSANQENVQRLETNQKVMIEALREMVHAQKEMTKAQKDSLTEQREQTCLQRLDPNIRDREDICRRAAGRARE